MAQDERGGARAQGAQHARRDAGLASLRLRLSVLPVRVCLSVRFLMSRYIPLLVHMRVLVSAQVMPFLAYVVRFLMHVMVEHALHEAELVRARARVAFRLFRVRV